MTDRTLAGHGVFDAQLHARGGGDRCGVAGHGSSGFGADGGADGGVVVAYEASVDPLQSCTIDGHAVDGF